MQKGLFSNTTHEQLITQTHTALQTYTQTDIKRYTRRYMQHKKHRKHQSTMRLPTEASEASDRLAFPTQHITVINSIQH